MAHVVVECELGVITAQSRITWENHSTGPLQNQILNKDGLLMTHSQLEFTFGGQNHEFSKYVVYNTFNFKKSLGGS